MYKKSVIFILLILNISTIFSQNSFYCYPEKSYFKNVSYYKKPNYADNQYIFESHYNYINVALTLTANCSSDYEKICAIYKWICDNIEYDTSYKIHDADNCFDNRKGVCQAYCNLFYYIAESIGIRCEIVGGKSKDYHGNIGGGGHSWIFAYTEENYGILLDPTWGAGSVNGNEFIKNIDCWQWFNVDPKWMILSHFPDDKSYQLLSEPVSLSQFYSWPPIKSIWLEYGLDPIDIQERIINGNHSLPTFFANGTNRFEIVDMPMQESLKIGQFYTLKVKMLCNNDIAIINEDVYIRKDEWRHEGNNIYSIDFMPKRKGCISFNIKDDYENVWNTMIQYEIDDPSQNDWNNLERYYPLDSPIISKVKNIKYKDEWKDAGISESGLAQLIKENNVKELPIIYTGKGKELSIVSVPMNMELKAGKSYTFVFYPKRGYRWAVINNDQWHKQWNIAEDGRHSMTITPQTGELGLYIQFNDGESYYQCIGYKCE